ncbi:MAG TPA: DUF4126 domain-containing protein [Burkholderiales bacterium]
MTAALHDIALVLALAWAAGINLYAALLVFGLMGHYGHVDLPPALAILADPRFIAAAGVMFAIEFFADKVPGVDSLWDAVHTFIRIPAGAVLAAGAAGDYGPAIQSLAALSGGALAAGSHFTKAGSRVLINTSPEPFSNWAASLSGDALVVTGIWAAVTHPLWFLAGLVLFIALAIWLLPKVWRGVKRLFAMLHPRGGGDPGAPGSKTG